MNVFTVDGEQELLHEIAHRRDVLHNIKEELIDGLQLDLAADDIDDTFLFGSGLALDSIDAMEIVIGMESRFA